MDKKAFIEKLNSLFCENNRKDKRYSQIWLSEVDFGGLYENDMYVLNVKAEHQIDSCNREIQDIIQMLADKAYDELASIWKVVVYNADEQVHCMSLEMLVFDKAKSCDPA